MRYNVTLLIILCITYSVSAQVNFQENIVIDGSTSTEGPTSLFTIDLDNDGDIDVLAAFAIDNKIAWYENINGTVMFEKQKIISLNADNAKCVFAADINGDNFIDVLSVSNNDNKVAWYENLNGQGNFGSQQIITTQLNSPESVFVKDIDQDGDNDVLVASSLDDQITLFKNLDGLGTFGNGQIVTSNADFATFVIAVDIDGDDKIDVLSSSENDGKVAWYQNQDGIGSFSTENVISIYDIPTSIDTVDIDGDSDIDVLVSYFGTNEIIWYENVDGLGNFNSGQVITNTANQARFVYSGDLDGDGDIDVLSASEGDRKIAWYENLNGNFGTPQIISINSQDAIEVRTADLDNDGDLDVLGIQTNAPSEVYYHENLDGFGNFSEINLITTGVDSVKSLSVADIDGDGFKDLVSASQHRSKIAWYKNEDGMGSYGVQRIISLNVSNLKSIYTSDLDGDGDMDVLSASENDNKIAWYENADGMGNFSPQILISLEESRPIDIFSIDVDGDKDMDIISGGIDGVAWFENLDGLGNFSTSKKISFSDTAFKVFAIDLDNDEDIDVLTAAPGDNTISWYENLDGLGDFGNQQIISTSLDYPESIYANDIDGDGDIDVLSASRNDDTIAWYENLDGFGNFSLKKIITNMTDGASSVFSIDMDNDGDADVISASRNDNTIAWYENINSEGIFGEQKIITTNEVEANTVFAIDIDEDGDIDIFPSAEDFVQNQGSQNFDKISWYENTNILNVLDNALKEIILFPIPTNDILTVISEKPINTIEIYSNKGEFIAKCNMSNKIDLTSFSQGLYFVKIILQDENIVVKQVVKN